MQRKRRGDVTRHTTHTARECVWVCRRRDRRTHDEVGGARSARRLARGSALARRASPVSALTEPSRRCNARGAVMSLDTRRTRHESACGCVDGATGARTTKSAALGRHDDSLAARRSLAVVVSARVSRRGVRWRSSNEAEREDDVGRRSAVRPERRTPGTTTRSARARRGRRRDQGTTMLAARRALAVVVSARVSRRGVRWRSSNEAEREDDVGRRSAVRPERRTREHDGTIGARSTRSAARSRNDVLAARRALAVVVSARVSRRGVRWRSSNEAEREGDVGRRSAVRPERRTREHDDTIGARSTRSAARSRNDVLAARRALAVVVSARVSRRGVRWRSSNEAEREGDVGRRSAVRPERRTREHDDTDRRALDEVGGAIKERRARGSARARRRRVGSGEPARGAMEEQQRS